jgi:predicted Co/Zn/Cd cation transporter (cation efflux family)
VNLADPPLGNQPSRAPTELEATERSLLVFSAWMGVFFAVLGVGWGVAIQSGIILFDGIYSSFSILLTLLSIVALRALGKPDDVRYPFGRAVIEPLIVSMRSVAIISLCAYAALTAVLDIVRGAVSAPATSLGILYSRSAAGICRIWCKRSWNSGWSTPCSVS